MQITAQNHILLVEGSFIKFSVGVSCSKVSIMVFYVLLINFNIVKSNTEFVSGAILP